MAKPIEKQEYTTKEERLAALKRMARSINQKHGVECVTLASDLEVKKRASFGIPELDEATGGGIQHGVFSIIWGEPGCSKTTLAMQLAAKAQKDGKIVMWAALEVFDRERAESFGIDCEEMQVLRFKKAEGVLDTLIQAAESKLVDVFILDSIHSLAPKGMLEDSKGDKSMEDNTMGVLARKLAEFFPRAKDPVERANMAVLLIGQTRIKIGFICIEALTGGNALHHAAKFICRVRHGAKDDAPMIDIIDEDGKKAKKAIGFNGVFKFDKVQVSGCKPEQTTFSLPFYFESGYKLPKSLQAQVEAEEAEIEAQTAKSEVKESEPTLVPPSEEIMSPVASVSDSEPKKRRGRPKKG